jgi:DNA-nicking Smr family endonuclease
VSGDLLITPWLFVVKLPLPLLSGCVMAEDSDLFKQLVGDDVKPVKVQARAPLAKAKIDLVAQEIRRLSAEQMPVSRLDPLAGEPVEMVEPLAVLSYQKPGVQHGVFRNLRLGKYAIDARLDLHKMTSDKARQEVYQFIKDCVIADVRTALITHGKGEGRDSPALLKSCVAFWLPQLDEVLAFHSAQKQHGSYGATYVLLKKSDKKKQQTREQYTKR